MPRTVAAWPTASVTPSATSALRRAAVPNAIDGERSSTIHVTSTRSARCTRTCGTVVLAVTFQSISRTSSPGTYGRTWASSVPRPSSDERWSPASIPSTRRATVSSSAFRRLSGTGPGPGRDGVGSAPSAFSTRITRPRASQLEPRLRDGRDHRVEHVVRRPLLGQRLVGQDEAVPEGVLHERSQVAGDHVVASVDERERTRALHERDRPTRARTVGDELGNPSRPNESGSRVAAARLTA